MLGWLEVNKAGQGAAAAAASSFFCCAAFLCVCVIQRMSPPSPPTAPAARVVAVVAACEHQHHPEQQQQLLQSSWPMCMAMAISRCCSAVCSNSSGTAWLHDGRAPAAAGVVLHGGPLLLLEQQRLDDQHPVAAVQQYVQLLQVLSSSGSAGLFTDYVSEC